MVAVESKSTKSVTAASHDKEAESKSTKRMEENDESTKSVTAASHDKEAKRKREDTRRQKQYLESKAAKKRKGIMLLVAMNLLFFVILIFAGWKFCKDTKVHESIASWRNLVATNGWLTALKRLFLEIFVNDVYDPFFDGLRVEL